MIYLYYFYPTFLTVMKIHHGLLVNKGYIVIIYLNIEYHMTDFETNTNQLKTKSVW